MTMKDGGSGDMRTVMDRSSVVSSVGTRCTLLRSIPPLTPTIICMSVSVSSIFFGLLLLLRFECCRC